jgi:DNA-binding SARP family transcriptional activator/tetratricopeptide (TPR) repeat protein
VYGGTVELRLLGPVELRAGDRVVSAGQPRQCAVLAALAVDAGRLVTVGTLVDRVWAEEPPAGARRALYSHIARIRRMLAEAGAVDGMAARVVRGSGGYTLDVATDLVDLHRFRRLVDGARQYHSGELAGVRSLREALDLWRGEPLAGVPGPWAERMREVWRQEYLDAAVTWALGEVRSGRPGAVIGPLTDLLAEYPLVESVAAAMMQALYAAGRAAEALDCYAATRRRLIDELGADPGAELQRLQQAMLRGEFDQGGPPAGSSPTPPATYPPAQLPLDVYGFTGRDCELAELDAILAKAADQPTAVIVSAVSGMAGVGKTALAVHWAHRVGDQFPDGQLYLNLRGFDPGGQVMSAAEALRGLLDALGVPAARVPVGLDSQAALYRSVLAGRRVLVLLDNAHTAKQVRPLLPGSPGCLVVVTSRSDLSSLVATEGAHPLTLDLLPGVEARQLLARRLGTDRVGTQPQAVDEIVDRCARLPLALAVVAARAATHPGLPLDALAAELRAAAGSLDAFDGGGALADVRAVFSWSHRTLSAPAGRLFRLFGLHRGPDISAAAVVSLAGLAVGQVRPMLAELSHAHLITEPTAGRYTVHDLLCAYARELTNSLDPAAEQHAAQRRLLDHYLHTAYAATLLLDPYRDRLVLAPAQSGVAPEELADHRQALAWFSAEHHVLPAVIRWAAAAGFDRHACQLAWAVADFLYRQGSWAELIATQRLALAAAQRSADLHGQALAHRWLARAWVCGRNRYEDAAAHYGYALELHRELEDRTGQAYALLGLARVHRRQGHYRGALSAALGALDLFELADDLVGQASARNSIGWSHALLGDGWRAISDCRRAFTLYREIGDRLGAALSLCNLGYAHHRLGEYRQATAHYQQALEVFRDAGTRFHEARTLTELGDSYHAMADPGAARAAWQQALTILSELSHPDADRVRTKIHQLAPLTVSPFHKLLHHHAS